MSDFAIGNLAWLSVALLLAALALRRRQLPLGTIVRGVLGWLAIGLVIYLIVSIIQQRGERQKPPADNVARLDVGESAAEGDFPGRNHKSDFT